MMPTAAQLYLRNLANQHPLPRLPADVLEEMARELGLPPGTACVESGDRVEDLLNGIHSALPPIAQQLLREGKLVVGEVGVDTPAVYVKSLDGNEFAVVLHSGLFAFLYRITRSLASAVFRETPVNATGIDSAHFARVIAEVFWWFQKTGHSAGPDYPISTEQKHLANVLAMRAERFLLAHEIGHVLVAMRLSDPASGPALDETTEEHLADVLALEISLQAHLSSGEKDNELWLMLTYAGAELALQIWGVMERINWRFADGVHPPAAERIALLRHSLRQLCDSDESFENIAMTAKVIGKAFDEVGSIIDCPGEHAATFDSEGAALVADLTNLLDRCSQDQVPDYVTFYQQAPALLARGYPEDILHQVVVSVAARFEAMKVQGPGGGASLTDFRKYKLLFGLTENLREPMRSLYASALGIDSVSRNHD